MAPSSSMLAIDATDKLRELVTGQRDSASRQRSSHKASDSRQHPTPDTEQQQLLLQQATGTGRRTARGTSPRAGGSCARSVSAMGQAAKQAGVGRANGSTYEHSGKQNSFAYASAAYGGDRADGRHADVIGCVSQGDNHSPDESLDDGRSDRADEQKAPCKSHGADSECAPSLHRLQQQHIPESQVPPPGRGMMLMPCWPTPFMPYGQVPGVPGMPYMVGPTGGMGNMPMLYPNMPVTPNGGGSSLPGYAFSNPASCMPNGMVAPPGVAPQMPMYMNMYPPLALWAGAARGAYAPPQQWPMPFPIYPNDQAAFARLGASVSTPDVVIKPLSRKPRKQQGGAATGDSRPPANSDQHAKSAPHTPAVRNVGNNNSIVNNTLHDSGSAQHDNNGIRRDSSETASTSEASGTFGTLPGHNRGCASVGSSSMHPASSGGASENRMRHLATVYVGNLAPSVEENVLYATFIQFGQVTNAQIIRHPVNGISKGYGFVSFKHPPSATMAVHHMNGVNLMGAFQGRAIKVSRYTKANFKDVNNSTMVWPPHPVLLQTPKVLAWNLEG